MSFPRADFEGVAVLMRTEEKSTIRIAQARPAKMERDSLIETSGKQTRREEQVSKQSP